MSMSACARSCVELRPQTTHGSLGPKGVRQAVAPRKPSSPTAHSRPVTVDPVGSDGRKCITEHAARGRQCVVADGVVADPGRRCPELVMPILLTDIGICMSQQSSLLVKLTTLPTWKVCYPLTAKQLPRSLYHCST
jgi:hypothetical protein